MPVIMRERSVAANSTDDNLLSGSTYEIMTGNVLMSIGVTAAATGTFITILSGTDTVLEESPPNVLTRYPVIPDEMYFTDVATAAERILIRARNDTAGAIIHRAIVQLTFF